MNQPLSSKTRSGRSVSNRHPLTGHEQRSRAHVGSGMRRIESASKMASSAYLKIARSARSAPNMGGDKHSD